MRICALAQLMIICRCMLFCANYFQRVICAGHSVFPVEIAAGFFAHQVGNWAAADHESMPPATKAKPNEKATTHPERSPATKP